MNKVNQTADTVIIVLHEIYGINKHIKDYCHALSKHGFDIICPNLLNREEPFDYSAEDIAYNHFMEDIGFYMAAEQVKKLIADVKYDYQNVFIIGFSVGATISWLCSQEESLNGIVAYYGSRIRDYTDYQPACPALLIFSKEEASFNVNELVTSLSSKQNLIIQRYNGEHGFSDLYSLKGNKALAKEAYHHAINFIKNSIEKS